MNYFVKSHEECKISTGCEFAHLLLKLRCLAAPRFSKDNHTSMLQQFLPVKS